MNKIDKNYAPKGCVAVQVEGVKCNGCKYDGTLGKLCLGGKPSGFFCTAGFRPDHCNVIYVDKPTLEQQLGIARKEMERAIKSWDKASKKCNEIKDKIYAKEQGKKKRKG